MTSLLTALDLTESAIHEWRQSNYTGPSAFAAAKAERQLVAIHSAIADAIEAGGRPRKRQAKPRQPPQEPIAPPLPESLQAGIERAIDYAMGVVPK